MERDSIDREEATRAALREYGEGVLARELELLPHARLSRAAMGRHRARRSTNARFDRLNEELEPAHVQRRGERDRDRRSTTTDGSDQAWQQLERLGYDKVDLDASTIASRAAPAAAAARSGRTPVPARRNAASPRRAWTPAAHARDDRRRKSPSYEHDILSELEAVLTSPRRRRSDLSAGQHTPITVQQQGTGGMRRPLWKPAAGHAPRVENARPHIWDRPGADRDQLLSPLSTRLRDMEDEVLQLDQESPYHDGSTDEIDDIYHLSQLDAEDELQIDASDPSFGHRAPQHEASSSWLGVPDDESAAPEPQPDDQDHQQTVLPTDAGHVSRMQIVELSSSPRMPTYRKIDTSIFCRPSSDRVNKVSSFTSRSEQADAAESKVSGIVAPRAAAKRVAKVIDDPAARPPEKRRRLEQAHLGEAFSSGGVFVPQPMEASSSSVLQPLWHKVKAAGGAAAKGRSAAELLQPISDDDDDGNEL